MQVLRKRAHGIYEVEQLNSSEALELFHLNSSRKNSCTADYIEMSNWVVAYANGVPLALKVLGSFFYSKDKEEWKSELNKLKLVPNIEIQNALKLSFEGLDDRDKEIFLDIACFFKGNDRDDVQSILNACGLFADIGIRVLIDKSLITIEGNRLWMHDLLQEMGKEIVRQQSIKEPGNRSRLWIAEDVYHLLKNNTGTAAVEGIFLGVHELHRDVHLSPAAFLKTYNLRLLKISNSSSIYNINFPQGIRFLPNSLRYLHWDGYPLKSLPSSFIPRNLVELQMCYSKVKQLWCGVQNLGNLKKINLSYSKRLTQIPDLSWAPNLESLDLEYCESLHQLPPCFEYLEKLAFLSIRGCRKIKNLPEIPENIEFLNLGEAGVRKFPSSVWSLNKLNTLILYNCKGLDNLPANTCKLQSLELLSLWGCKSLQKFPDAPRNITYLCLAGTAIERVPSSIECLSCLIIFDMSGCKRLESLPTSIGKLKYLESLYLSDCSNFKNFPEIMEPMEYLESVYLNGTATEEIPSSIENLISLELLMLSRCKNLEFVPENICIIHGLHLHFSGCSKIENFPPLSVSGRCFLEGLYFNGCKRLVQVPDHISCLSSLQHLDLSESNIESLPASIKHLSQLSRLYLRKCEKLKFLPELPPFLQLLEAVDCNSLESVSSSRTELIQGWYRYFLCSEELNYCKCSKLDQDARSNIMADARLRILRMATKSSPIFGSRFKYDVYREASLSICYPGNQIPEWYSYQSMGSSINIKLPRGWHNSNFLGFALCAVVRGPLEGNFRHLNLKFQWESSFKTNYGESRKCACTLNKQRLLNKLELGNSDHIFQWYSCSLYFDVMKEKVEANRSTSFYDCH